MLYTLLALCSLAILNL
ncbi:hypothetical protein AB4G90_03695 [Limosilactobacillus reuteri]